MKTFQMDVCIETLYITAENEEQAELKYDAYQGGEPCPCGADDCECVDASEDVFHTTEEIKEPKPLPSFAEFINSINPLTVGDLRAMLAGVDDSTQVLIGSPVDAETPLDWYQSDWFNVSHDIKRPDMDTDYSALTLYMVDNYDSRQF